MNSQEINNNVLGAMQILIDKSMTNLVGGETVICTIVDDTERQLGKYRVSPNEVVIYDAYSENTEYLEGEQVLVLIPDKSSDKRTIIRKYISKNTLEPLHYVSPAKQFIVESELYNSDNEIFDIKLNDATEKESILSNGEITIDAFDTCYIQTRFLCNVTENVTSGNYGLKFTLTEKNPIDKNKVHYAEVILDSSEMMGNPYRFIAPFMQEKIGYWKDLPEGAYTWSLILYQNNNFKNKDGEPITGASVTVSDIKIQIGYDVIAIPNKTVKLFHSGTNFYDNSSTNKTVSLVWYKKSNDNEYVGFGEDNTQYWSETIDEAKQCGTIVDVHSDKLTLTLILDTNQRIPLIADKNEQFEDWKNTYSIGKLITYTITKDEDEKNIIYTPKIIDEGTNVYFIDWQQDNSRGNLVSGLGEQPSHTTYNCICQSTLEKTRVNAVLWENGFAYPAEKMLEFENKGERTVDLNLTGVTMKIKHGANSKEAYTKYDGTSNQLIESTEAYINRTLEFNWDTDLPENAIRPEFWDGAQIAWYIPADGTMLMPENKDMTPENGYYVIKNSITHINESLSGHTVNYRIKDYYSPQLTNNTIKCQVTVTQTFEGQEIIQALTGEITIGFGLFGTSGTDYTIVVTSKNIIFNNENYKLQFKIINAQGEIDTSVTSAWVRLNNFQAWQKVTLPSDTSLFEYNFGQINIDSYNLIQIKAEVNYNNSQIEIATSYPLILIASAGEGNLQPQDFQIFSPTTILYNSKGQEPQYLNQSLWNVKVKEEAVNNLEWYIRYWSNDSSFWIEFDDGEIYQQIAIGLPVINQQVLSVPPLFLEQEKYGVALTAEWESGWALIPIIITRNQYESPLLNEWDSAMQIDEQNNYILSTMIGAGKKNSDNTFSGIIMGEKATLNSKSNTFRDHATGLFGFNKGIQSYEFNVDGTAFIGTSGQGQIRFDGNRGYIASRGVVVNSDGEVNMPIDGGSIFDLKNGNLWLQQGDGDKFKFADDEFSVCLNSTIKEECQNGETITRSGKYKFYIKNSCTIEKKDIETGNTSEKNEYKEGDSGAFTLDATSTIILVSGEPNKILLELEYQTPLFSINREELLIGNQYEYLHFTPDSCNLQVSSFNLNTNGQITMLVDRVDGFTVSTPLNNSSSIFQITAPQDTDEATNILLQSSNALYTVMGATTKESLEYYALTVKAGYTGYNGVGLYDVAGNRIGTVEIKKGKPKGRLDTVMPLIASPIGVDKTGYYALYYLEPTASQQQYTVVYVNADNMPQPGNGYNAVISIADITSKEQLKIGYVKSGNSGLTVATTTKYGRDWTIPGSVTSYSGSKMEINNSSYLYMAGPEYETQNNRQETITVRYGLILGNDPNDSSQQYALRIGKWGVKWDGTVETNIIV